MLQSVWATSKASKRSRGQAQRRNPLSFTKEPKTKKMRVEDQDMSEETRRETVKKVGLQPSSDALVRRSPSSVPRLVISEFAILPTQPGPALDFYADSLYDQALRRSPAPSCVSIEHALSKLNKNPTLNQRLDRLYPTRSEKGETVIEICSNLIRSQEGFLAIGNLAQHEWKFCALIIAFGLLTRQVGDRNIMSRAFARAVEYFMMVLGLGSRSPWRLINVMEEEDLLLRLWGEDKFEVSLRYIVRNFWNQEPVFHVYTKKSGKARMRKSRAVIQFGNVFWEEVASLALRIPEVDDMDDIVTQVGLMCAVLVDTHILCSHSMSDRAFHHWSQDIFIRSVILMNATGENLSMQDKRWKLPYKEQRGRIIPMNKAF